MAQNFLVFKERLQQSLTRAAFDASDAMRTTFNPNAFQSVQQVQVADYTKVPVVSRLVESYKVLTPLAAKNQGFDRYKHVGGKEFKIYKSTDKRGFIPADEPDHYVKSTHSELHKHGFKDVLNEDVGLPSPQDFHNVLSMHGYTHARGHHGEAVYGHPKKPKTGAHVIVARGSGDSWIWQHSDGHKVFGSGSDSKSMHKHLLSRSKQMRS